MTIRTLRTWTLAHDMAHALAHDSLKQSPTCNPDAKFDDEKKDAREKQDEFVHSTVVLLSASGCACQ